QRVLQERVYLPFDEMRRAAYVSVTSAITSKLRAYADSESTRHLDDIASIIRVQGEKINVADIDIVAARLKVLGAWRQVWEANRLDA
ncbi:MAG: hypothetical protein L0332_12270, partial [Chloroflexi bacterium]|nr:hypothetical protein [Chloroflexota bacterium]